MMVVASLPRYLSLSQFLFEKAMFLSFFFLLLSLSIFRFDFPDAEIPVAA